MTTGERRVGNLPMEMTSLVGRRAELAQLKQLCQRSRLVTVTGVGGVGKTRVALRAAAQLQPRFRDGVWLVQLSTLDEGTLIAHDIAEALPVADQTTRPMIDVLADYLADRDLLLVLDTCEHLVDACAMTAETLLAAAPGLRILATSRRRLGPVCEQVMTLDPLPIHERSVEAGESEEDAVRLLADRAAAAAPGFAVTAANRAELVQLCLRLEGLPLAIELAAARLDHLSVPMLIERLGDRFALLSQTEDAAPDADPPWHRALRTAIGWSHELCSPAERLLWARCSSFAGTFDAAAAREVCADERLPAGQIAALLAGLADKSILTWTPTGAGERYRMLDTIREYGAGWLRRLGGQDELRCRHRDYYRALALRADAAWMGPDQITWYGRMAADHANFRAALDFCLGEGEDGHAALELGGALWFLWLACGFQHEGRHYIERALRQCPVPLPVRSKAVWACAAIALGQGDLTTVVRLGEGFRAEAEASGDPAMLVAAAHLDGGYLALSGNPAQAATVFDAAPYTQEHGGAYTGAHFLTWTMRVFVHVNLGEFTEAAAVADAMRTACIKRGERWARAFADYVGGLAAHGLGQLDEAATYARTALEGKALLHDNIGIGTAIDLLASVAAATGEGEQAARLLGIGQQAWDTIGRSQLGVPELIAAREACELQARESAGDAAYEEAFRQGVESKFDDGIAYALAEPNETT